MLKKLHHLYAQSLLSSTTPDFRKYEHYYWFYSDTESDWLGIPKNELAHKELTILKTLYHLYDPSSRTTLQQSWYDFLFSNGELPYQTSNEPIRLIHFKMKKMDWEKEDVESALKNFFIANIFIVWVDELEGVILEKLGEHSSTKSNLSSLLSNLESDLFIRMSIYVGKPHEVDATLPNHFLQERKWFKEGLHALPSERIFNFEKVFPFILVEQMSHELKQHLLANFSLFNEDRELLKTIRIFIECSFNVSLTAKKMYIHRNTLQYRIERFTEKTGINLKDYHQVSTVYFACLLFSQDD
ncbi:hypothetical protein J27TS8_17930 [Robertmurraya siralis]|uniref:PucR C-terminal helix-turn-helix domain-containing protein n=1 Tax=Robertmurraya siralis TaxID=77777 RepID=A0A919WGY7_9BACI|nr:helix-turn-helix domain-containing protein [Robertmurraya siralis]GIN61800.1 hypothetical protein J27TS8_17930 [Robertmurraya siralis]